MSDNEEPGGARCYDQFMDRIGTTRRALLGALAAAPVARAVSEKGQVLPSTWAKYLDPATEFEVLRLTDAAWSSFLPCHYARCLSRHNNFLLFASDRAGSLAAYRMDLKSGQWRQLSDGEGLDPSTLTLMPDERSFCFFRGRQFIQIGFTGLREREVYRTPDNYERGAGFSVSEDGLYATVAERRGASGRLVLVGMARGDAKTVVEADTPVEHPIPRPKRAGILYRRPDGSLWLVNYDGLQNRRLNTAGAAAAAQWSPDGRAVIYIHMPEDRRQLHGLRELVPDTNRDQLIAPTSQFVSFGKNADASVFIGASASKASPHLLILLRVARRELTVCEHRSSDPALVAPIFAPSSQRVYFQSDRHGKPAIYSIALDRFVEKTDTI